MRLTITANAAWNIWNFRRQLVESLLGDRHRITVFAAPDETVPELEKIGCDFRPLEISARGLSPVQGLRLTRLFREEFKADRPDAVLSYTIKNNIFGARAARAERVPFLPNVTGLGTAFLSGPPLRFVAELLYREAFMGIPVIFFQNADDQNLFIDRKLVRADQARLLPGSGVDLDHFSPVLPPRPDEPPIFLMIARVLRDKGVIEYVEAARQVRARHPNVRFQLLGAIGAENRTAISASTVESWVAEGVIEYLGTTPDVRPAIAAATCVVLPSYREGAPRTLIEAAAMARPVIATDVPGCRSVVDRGVSGLLCAPRSAESLATAINCFLATSSEAQRAMGLAGRAKMQQEFDQVIVVDAYREALAGLAR